MIKVRLDIKNEHCKIAALKIVHLAKSIHADYYQNH